jgi:hypothetical protein
MNEVILLYMLLFGQKSSLVRHWNAIIRICNAQYAMTRPSFLRRGYIVSKLMKKVLILDTSPWWLQSIDMGTRGIRMLFSCTMYEKRKKHKEVFAKHSVNVLVDGLLISIDRLGRHAKIVVAAHSLARVGPEKYLFHLNTSEDTHQKFAT